MYQIREMEISDYENVMALWGETEHLAIKDADSKPSIAAYLKRNPGLSFVVLDNEKTIAAVLVGTDGRRGYLQHLSVDSDYRGQGIGQQLVSRATDALAALGIAKTHLFVLSDNHAAQNFYQKMGWFARDEVRMFSFNSSSNRNV